MSNPIKLPEGSTAIIGTMMRHRQVSVRVYYNGITGRLSKDFSSAVAARKFYLRQAAAGKEPSLTAENP